jgi:hypothetical protein
MSLILYYFCCGAIEAKIPSINDRMTIANKNIVDTYTKLFEGLDSVTKIELIERLSKSIKKGKGSVDEIFFNSFGAFPDSKPAEKIITEIKSTRKFREKDIKI